MSWKAQALAKIKKALGAGTSGTVEEFWKNEDYESADLKDELGDADNVDDFDCIPDDDTKEQVFKILKSLAGGDDDDDAGDGDDADDDDNKAGGSVSKSVFAEPSADFNVKNLKLTQPSAALTNQYTKMYQEQCVFLVPNDVNDKSLLNTLIAGNTNRVPLLNHLVDSFERTRLYKFVVGGEAVSGYNFGVFANQDTTFFRSLKNSGQSTV